jgi:hypothetical protein
VDVAQHGHGGQAESEGFSKDLTAFAAVDLRIRFGVELADLSPADAIETLAWWSETRRQRGRARSGDTD